MRKRLHGFRLRPLIVRNTNERVPRTFLVKWVMDVSQRLQGEKITVRARRRLTDADEVSLVFVSKKEIRRLNRTFRGKDQPTDVLSFAPTDVGSLGELVFSLEVIQVQAGEHGLSSKDELGYMVLHGILHLLGYDHEKSASAARRMFAVQDRVFEAMADRSDRTLRNKL